MLLAFFALVFDLEGEGVSREGAVTTAAAAYVFSRGDYGWSSTAADNESRVMRATAALSPRRRTLSFYFRIGNA